MSDIAPNPAISAFTEDHVARLTGLSVGQLRSWDRAGFFVPHSAYEDRRRAYSRLYSFRDVVGLRTIAVLLKEHHVSLRELKRAAHELTDRGFKNWANIKLYVVNRQVHFRLPNSSAVEGIWDGQYAMLPVIDVINDISDRVSELKQRTASQFGKIEQNRYVARNSWVISGTRIPTASIRRFSEAGYSVEQIMREYPTLTRQDVEEALSHENRLASTA
jgi:uncharacterized protein (DUF433 family)